MSSSAGSNELCYVLVLTMLWTGIEPQSCPSPCVCSGRPFPNPDQNVSCQNLDLSTIPDGLPISARILRLGGNSIKTITSDRLSDLQDLRTLDLSANLISDISENAFAGLVSLHTLDLTANKLEFISPSIFEGLENLQNLSLRRNPVVCLRKFTFAAIPSLRFLDLGELTKLRAISKRTFYGIPHVVNLNMARSNLIVVPYMNYLNNTAELDLSRNNITSISSVNFQGMFQLSKLVLSSNKISRIERNSFDDLSLLSDLDLSNNSLTMLPFGLFDNMLSVVKMDLRDNPWSCTCEATWLSQWFKDNMNDNSRTTLCGKCRSPSAWRNTPMCDVPLESLKCSPPRITDTQGFVNVTEGDSAALLCRTTRDAGINWITPNGTNINKRGAFKVRIKLTPEGNLNITNVTKSDEGVYRCIARNTAGISEIDTVLKVPGRLPVSVSAATEMPVIEELLDDQFDSAICAISTTLNDRSTPTSIPVPTVRVRSGPKFVPPTDDIFRAQPGSGKDAATVDHKMYIIASISAVVALGIVIWVTVLVTTKCSKWKRKRKMMRKKRMDRTQVDCPSTPTCLKSIEQDEPIELPDVYNICNGGSFYTKGVMAFPTEETIV